MDLTIGLGYLAMTASLAVLLCGFPVQIKKNYQRQSCEGLSLSLMVMCCLSYLIWAVYGFSKPDWFLVGSQIPGVFFTLIILIQFVKYGRKN